MKADFDIVQNNNNEHYNYISILICYIYYSNNIYNNSSFTGEAMKADFHIIHVVIR